MKTNKYVEELKAKTAAELNEELVAAKKELFNLRFQNATNQLDNTSRIKEVRKNIARIQTVITEKPRVANKTRIGEEPTRHTCGLNSCRYDTRRCV